MATTEKTKHELAPLYKALAGFQKEDFAIVKDAKNPHYGQKYATLHAIMGEVRPLLNKHGLVLIQKPNLKPYVGVADTHYVSVTTQIIHADTCQGISCEVGSVTSGEPQKVGSAITYLRRYGISAILGLVTEDDDDGNATRQKDKPKDKPSTVPKTESGAGVVEGKEETPDEVDHRKRTLLWKIMLKMNHDIIDDARQELKLLSGFTPKGKDYVPGKETVADLSGKWLARVLRDAEAEYEEWKKREETTGQEEQSEYPF